MHTKLGYGPGSLCERIRNQNYFDDLKEIVQTIKIGESQSSAECNN